jgi:nucleotide-binding universal stress UspA family protein
VLAVSEMPLDLVAPRGPGLLGDGPGVPAGLPAPPEVQAAPERAHAIVADATAEVVYDWTTGDTAAGIVDVARARGDDLLVVGSGHHRLLERLPGDDLGAGVRAHAGREVLVVG